MSSAPVPPAGPMPPVAQQPKPNNVIWWILGILGGGLVILVFFGLTLAGVIVHYIHVAHDGNKVAIETPVGDLKVNKAMPHATGLSVFPGATPTGKNTSSIQFGTPESGLAMATEEYETSDPLDKVKDWYRSRLGPDFEMETSDHNGSRRLKIDGVHVGDHQVTFASERGGGARIVALDKSFHGTKITLVRLGTHEAQ